MDELLTSSEVLVELKISRSSLDRLLATGQLTAQRIGENGNLRFKRADVRALLTTRPSVARAQLPARGMMKFG